MATVVSGGGQKVEGIRTPENEWCIRQDTHVLSHTLAGPTGELKSRTSSLGNQSEGVRAAATLVWWQSESYYTDKQYDSSCG